MSIADAIREHYDSMAPFYRLMWGDHIHHGLFRDEQVTPQQAQLELVEHCANLVAPIENCDVLDVGCGHGATCIHLAQKYGCRVTGITISPRQVEIAHASARDSSLDGAAKFCLADIEEIDLPGSAFDVVWTMESSEHFQDKPCYLRKAATALKPGGKLLLATWTGCMKSPRMRDVADMFLCPNLQTADDYVRQLQAAGLALVDQQDLTDQVVNTWEICRSRIEPLMDNVGWLPEPVRKFVAGINTIQQAYSSGDLSYSILVARK